MIARIFSGGVCGLIKIPATEIRLQDRWKGKSNNQS